MARQAEGGLGVDLSAGRTLAQVPYHELGGTYFAHRDPEQAIRRAIAQLNQLRYTVTSTRWREQPDLPRASARQSVTAGRSTIHKRP